MPECPAEQRFEIIYVTHVYPANSRRFEEVPEGIELRLPAPGQHKSKPAPATTPRSARPPASKARNVRITHASFCYGDDFERMELDDIISYHDLVTDRGF
jgi:hypothetical protein